MMIITSPFWSHFLHIIQEILPIFLVALIAAALIDEFVPQKLIVDYFSRTHFAAILNASLIGTLVPICTCGMIPLAFKLLKKGLHWKIMSAFLISGAACSLPALGLSMVLGWDIVLIRFFAAVLFGVLVSYLLAAFAGKDFELELLNSPASHCCDSEKHNSSKTDRASRIMKDVMMMIQDFLPWIIAAALIASYFHFHFEEISELSLIKTLSANVFIGPVVGSLLGFPFYFCAGADVPISRELLDNAVPLGTVVAFMTVAPGVNITSLLVYKQCIGLTKALVLTASAIVVASGLGVIINLFF